MSIIRDIPVKAGIHFFQNLWMPLFASCWGRLKKYGMTAMDI
jgi:hypothetical protein